MKRSRDDVDPHEAANEQKDENKEEEQLDGEQEEGEKKEGEKKELKGEREASTTGIKTSSEVKILMSDVLAECNIACKAMLDDLQVGDTAAELVERKQVLGVSGAAVIRSAADACFIATKDDMIPDDMLTVSPCHDP